jgi:hypothetical protein
MQQQQLNFDLSKTTPIEPPSGGKIWLSGVVLRKVSKFVTGASEDGIVPIPVFFDPETKQILEDTIPKEIREDYKYENIIFGVNQFLKEKHFLDI